MSTSAFSEVRLPNARVHRLQVGDLTQHRVAEHAGHRPDVGEVTRLFAVAMDGQGLPAQRGVDEGQDHRGIRVARRLGGPYTLKNQASTGRP